MTEYKEVYSVKLHCGVLLMNMVEGLLRCDSGKVYWY